MVVPAGCVFFFARFVFFTREGVRGLSTRFVRRRAMARWFDALAPKPLPCESGGEGSEVVERAVRGGSREGRTGRPRGRAVRGRAHPRCAREAFQRPDEDRELQVRLRDPAPATRALRLRQDGLPLDELGATGLAVPERPSAWSASSSTAAIRGGNPARACARRMVKGRAAPGAEPEESRTRDGRLRVACAASEPRSGPCGAVIRDPS